MTTVTNKQKAQRQAIDQAVDRLRQRSTIGPEVRLRVFGRNLIIVPPYYEVRVEDSSEPVGPADTILVLHYLRCESPVKAVGQWISFRDFPGGQFYWEPFRSRTVKPLVDCFGGDLDRLCRALDVFDWEPFDAGDFAAKVQAVGDISLILVYYRGDEEFPPEAEILFDAAARHVYGAEDAAVLATRLCRGLINEPCVSCSECGMCAARALNKSKI